MKLGKIKSKLFRKYEGALFYSDVSSRKDRVYGFYLLLRPVLGWAKRALLERGLLAAEAESELFILCSRLFKEHKKYQSSIVPYLEVQIPRRVSDMLTRVSKYMCLEEEPSGFIDAGGEYNLDEEFYWTVPNILFEDRFVGKCFTNSEKYVISVLLAADEKDLTTKGLARLCNLDRRTMKTKLLDLQEVFNMEKTND
jgi:hypothetical protein